MINKTFNRNNAIELDRPETRKVYNCAIYELWSSKLKLRRAKKNAYLLYFYSSIKAINVLAEYAQKYKKLTFCIKVREIYTHLTHKSFHGSLHVMKAFFPFSIIVVENYWQRLTWVTRDRWSVFCHCVAAAGDSERNCDIRLVLQIK